MLGKVKNLNAKGINQFNLSNLCSKEADRELLSKARY